MITTSTSSTTSSTPSTPPSITPSPSTNPSNSSNSSNSSSTDSFPSLKEFTNLDQSKTRKAAKVALRGQVGVYSFICYITGARYIGSSIDIGIRLVQHLVTNNTNEHLQNAIEKYGLVNFTFAVVEFCDLEVLLKREQYYLDILFSLPANLRYNFARFAEAPFKGLTHSEESKAKYQERIIICMDVLILPNQKLR